MIHRLHLLNFKNLRNVSLDIGPLTILVGTNASGKSNLRDAFRFLHGMSRGYTLAEIIGEKYVEGGALQWKGIRGGTREVVCSGENTFTVETALPIVFRSGHRIRHGYQHRIRVKVGLSSRKPRVISESLWRRGKMVYDSHPDDDSPKQEGSGYLFVRLPRGGDNRKHGKRIRFISDRPVISQFVENTEVPAAQKRDAKHVLSELGSMRFLDLSPAAMKRPSLPGQVVLGDRGENLSSVLQAICEDESTKRAITEWISELTPLDVADFEFVPDQTGKVLVTLKEGNGQRTSAHSASDGTLRFLAMIAAMLGPDAAEFYFLEELDNGIHPTRLHLLLQLIEQSAKQGKVQVVATSHSPQLLAMLSEDALEHASLVYRLEDACDGHIRRILDIPEARDVLETRNLARLHESGWLEDAVAFLDAEEVDA
ncbi:MAG: AAA family ATPase [Candidatus Nealsonbacteria bacterium]|nr:AAA family ATPase [Candidatus Nealsonbacteria bacterium]